MICPNCQTNLPDEARFCLQCGAPQSPPTVEEATQQQGFLVWTADIAPQLETLFSTLLEERINRYGSPKRLLDYREQLYRSGFRDTVHHRVQQLVDELDRRQLQPDFDRAETETYLTKVLRDLADFFLIRHTNDLHPLPLPQALLKYQDARWATVDLARMIFDYLHLEAEEVPVYTDLLKMPKDKLRNAGRAWLFPVRDERIFVIVDLSLLGKVKEGFALTDTALYWKAPLQPARVVNYRDIETISREQDWLLINEHFFNADARLNTKLMLLLEKLAQIAE